ncbi:tryptophan-rich sensory protein [Nocardioides daedukensis]|uniref:Tryptophan-rich sensory protein n=1 Tax=Nocardioides daedukensis TaxID=634462 RepID=A0A7Y9S6B6_9ACTN|nr:TspO/MBR family protein [Nocardioides daedukensis]NYG60768.1 tryptophan-rich sensory protein [Nocardioides daedukensis]
MSKREILSSIGLPVAAAVTGSVATSSGVRSQWYEQLDKPRFQPPAAVFPIAWTLLYAGSALASKKAQDAMTQSDATDYRRRLAVNMALNSGWCWAFFRGQRLGASVVVAGALAASSTDLARVAGQASRPAGALLAPYAAWTGFATVLTTAIWRRNR